MAMRKPRTNSRLTAKSNQQQGVSERDEDAGERGGKPRKRKLSYMIGPPWSKDDLELFYQAYRKFGKDWKKVAGGVQKRTTEMVEALYGLNRAYLSLPEGAASAAGLIAMMTDHYSFLESDESGEEFGTADRSHQLQSRSRTRGAQVNNTNSGPSGYGGPSPAKKPRSVAASRSWVVGKRTPRYPAGNVVEQKGKSKAMINKLQQEMTSDEENDQKEEAAARVLITASHGPSSPLISKNTPTKRYSRALLQNGHAKELSLRSESDGSGPKHTASTSGEFGPEGSEESKEKPGRASTKVVGEETEVADKAKGQVADAKSKWKKPAAKKPKLQKQDVKFDEANEQCSQTGTQEGDTRENDEEKPASMQKKKQNSSQRTKKRSRQLFSGGISPEEQVNLVTLAELALDGQIPSPRPHSDSEKEADKPQTSDGYVPPHRSSAEKNVKEVEKREGSAKGGPEDEMSREQADKEDVQVASGSRQQSTSPPDSRKRKRKGIPEKNASQGKFGADEQGQSLAEPQVPPLKVETPVVLKPRRKPKRLTTAKTVSKQGLKVNKAGDASGLELELSVLGAGQHGPGDEGTLPLKLRSKKKGVAEKGPVNGFGSVSCSSVPVEIVKESPNCPHATAELGPFNTKARLIHCLSPKVRRWCMYEWFYSAIDLPWFAHNEFVEYLNHAGLGHVPRLTRVEWGVIRSSLGKPRRLSQNFLREEREKLEKYRETVRTHYHELRAGHREGLPSDLARPLTVGQRVIAKHPKTGQIHDGSILTVDRCRCRVQFDRPELGVEFVADIDAMPINPLENMPENMRKKRTVIDAVDRPQEDSKVDIKSRVAVSAGGAARTALNERLERPRSIPGLGLIFLNNLIKTAQANTVDSVRFAKATTEEAVVATQQALVTQPYTPGLSQARESDIRALIQLGGALNKKEPLVVELRRMNDEGAAYKGSEAFQQQYSSIVLQVKGVNEEVMDALKHLRNRHRYQDISTPSWQRGMSQARTVNGGPSPGEGTSLPGPVEADITTADIAASSRKHARAMVSVAVQSMSNLEEGEDPLSKIGGALDLIARGTPLVEGKPAAAASSSVTQVIVGTSTSAALSPPLAAADANGDVDKSAEVPASHVSAADAPTLMIEGAPTPDVVDQVSRGDGKDAMILSELMASCVATLLMVQTLTERQFPAPDVALTLDTALESLRPQAAQNHYLFKDIQQQLEYVKAQVLAQIPIQTSIPFPVDTPISQPNLT